MKDNREIERAIELRHRCPPPFAFSRVDQALKRGMEQYYDDTVTVEVSRRLEDILSQESLDKFGNPGRFGQPLAAVAYISATSLIVGLTVFSEEWEAQQLDALRVFCRRAGIRCYRVCRLEVYPRVVFERGLLADAYDIPLDVSLGLATSARCPYCRGPLIHRYMTTKYSTKRQGFYACLQYYETQGVGLRCKGFCCSIDDLPNYVDSGIERLRNQILSETQDHSNIYDPESLLPRKKGFFAGFLGRIRGNDTD